MRGNHRSEQFQINREQTSALIVGITEFKHKKKKKTMRRKYRMRVHDVSETNDSIYRKGLVKTGVAMAFRANHMKWMIKMGE